MKFALLALSFVLGLCGCAITESVRHPRPMRIECRLKSKIDRLELLKNALEKNAYRIISENIESGVVTAARFPSPVFLGDQVMFQGGLRLNAQIDSSAITLYLYKAMNPDKETPKLEVSYDEQNSPLYVKPFFDQLLLDLRRGCAAR
jgi:hypothetical protein